MDHAPSSPRPRRHISILVALIVSVATPATLALSYYRITGDPTFRPLAITLERLLAGGIEINHKAIRAEIESDGSPEGTARAARLARLVHAAFYGKGTEAVIGHRTTGQRWPTVTFFVGSASYGPYGESTAADGISAAAEALQFTRNAREADWEHRW